MSQITESRLRQIIQEETEAFLVEEGVMSAIGQGLKGAGKLAAKGAGAALKGTGKLAAKGAGAALKGTGKLAAKGLEGGAKALARGVTTGVGQAAAAQQQQATQQTAQKAVQTLNKLGITAANFQQMLPQIIAQLNMGVTENLSRPRRYKIRRIGDSTIIDI